MKKLEAFWFFIGVGALMWSLYNPGFDLAESMIGGALIGFHWGWWR